MLKKLSGIFISVFICALLPFPCMAGTAYRGYGYNEWNQAVPSAAGYEPKRVVTGDMRKKIAFQNPQDLFIDGNGDFYILNNGGNELVLLDKNFAFIRAIAQFKDRDGSAQTLDAATGIFVKDGRIYIADTGNNRVLVTDLHGGILRTLTRPDSELYPAEKDFKPTKVMADQLDNLYVISLGLYQGAVSFNKDGDFIEFFGSNKVEPTAAVLADMLWKRLFTKTQQSYSARYVPVEYTNFDIDKDNMIYTCTTTNQTSTGELRKLNALGNNLFLADENFGDKETLIFKGATRIDSAFSDVAVDGNGFVFALDSTRGRVFQYDNEGELVSVFGGKGNQRGTFKTPAAVDTYGESVYVLDAEKNYITEFSLTEYGAEMYRAILLFNNGEYLESKELWEKILQKNANNYLAYVGVGKALYLLGDNKGAAEYFRMGRDREQESQAFEASRKSAMRNAAAVLVAAAFVTLALLIAFKLRKRKRQCRQTGGRKTWAAPNKMKLKELRSILFHPSSGFDELKHKNSGSFGIASFIVIFWFFSSVIERQYKSFRFNTYDIDNTNVFYIFISTIVLFVFLAVANWSICTLTNGEGSFRQIWIACGYALLPLALSLLLSTAASYYFSLNELVFENAILMLGYIWSFLLLFIGLMQIHRFRFSQTVLSLLFTFCGVVIILFLCFLVIILFSQLGSFFMTIFEEIILRFNS